MQKVIYICDRCGSSNIIPELSFFDENTFTQKDFCKQCTEFAFNKVIKDLGNGENNNG